MRTLHAYLVRQILAALVMTILVFTFVLLLGNVLKEILNLIVNGQATILLVGKAVGLLIPFVLVFALPMGMLTATLLVFGRLSADQELTAARAGGISLVSLCTPVLLLGVAASTVSAWINLDLAPRCRTAYQDLFYTIGVRQVASFIQEGRFIDDFKDHIVYVGGKSGTRLRDVLIYKLDPADRRMTQRIHAKWAEVVSDDIHTQAVLKLHEVTFYDFASLRLGHLDELEKLALGARPDERSKRIPLSDLSFLQLRDMLVRLENEWTTAAAPPAGATADQLRERQQQVARAKNDLISPIRVQMHRQVAFSFASIGFTLIGIPLGVRAHRRETTAGVALALVLILVYYGFVILAQSLQEQPWLGPHLILWLPNFLFQVVGAALLWRANRGI